jgi:putative aldouronate transport system permease protein
MAKNHIRTSVSLKTFNIINYLVMTIFLFLCVYPFYYIVIYSISDTSVANKIFLLPSHINFSTYSKIFARGDLQKAFMVSGLRSILFTILCLFCTTFIAYLFTKKEMLFRKVVYRFFIITMYLNVGLIPWYITMKTYGLKDNFLLYIIPGLVNGFYIILVKTFIEQLPPSLEEAAAIDGAGFFTTYFRIILPLSKPIIATIAVYSAVGSWNSWQDNFFLVHNTNLQTVQLILYNYINEAQRLADSMKITNGAGITPSLSITPESVRMATTVVAVLPIMLVYPFLQRYFVKGIMMGSIKG